jgi:hypothetical protein
MEVGGCGAEADDQSDAHYWRLKVRNGLAGILHSSGLSES